MDGTTLAQFENQLRSFLTNEEYFVAVIASELRYINSSGMGALLKIVDRFGSSGGKLVLVDLPARLRELFEKLNILEVLPLYETVSDALRAFEELEAARTAKPEEAKTLYPILVRCTLCRNAIEIPDAGYYRCPRCGTCFAAAREGKVRGYRVDPAIGLEVRGPCTGALAPGLRELGLGLARARGLGEEEAESLGELLAECGRAISGGSGAVETVFRLVVATDDREVRIAVRTDEPLFGPDGPPAAREALQVVRAHLDEMEVVGLPGGGQMLRGVRQRRRAPEA